MIQHAFFAPSSAGCTVHCPAAPHLQAKFPRLPTDESKEGEASHWIGAEYLRGQGSDIHPGTLAPNGVIVDNAMIAGAELWADTAIAMLSEHAEPWQQDLHIEETLTGDWLHPSHNWGTPDMWALRPLAGAMQVVHLDDYKYGHKVIEVFECWQLIDYAAKICEHIGLDGLNDQNTYFNFRIVQPRAWHPDGPIRTWVVKASDLRPYFNKLRHAYAESSGPNPDARPGRWCKTQYCDAAHACDALHKAAHRVVSESYVGVAHQLSAADVGIELANLENAKAIIDARYNGLMTQAEEYHKAGQDVTNYTAERGKGRTVVLDQFVNRYILAGEALGLDLRKPQEAITPLQAMAKGVPSDAIKSFTEHKPGALKMKRRDDVAPQRVFNPLTIR